MIQKVIIGSLLLDHSIHDLVIPLLKPEYFDHRYRPVFEIMQEMHRVGQPIDKITLLRKQTGLTPLELAQLTDEIASTANILSYIQDLKDDYVKKYLETLTATPVDDPGYRLSELIKELTNLQNDHTICKDRSIVDIVEEALNELVVEKSTSGMIGVPLPSGKINSDTRGLRRGELVVLAGRPGMGKTAFALSIVRMACEAGLRVAYFTMEMKATELAKRIIKSYEDHEIGAGRLSTYKLHLFDRGGIDLSFIKANVRLLRGCDLVVVDYLGLMATNPKIKRNEAIGEVSRGLKAFALEENIPILLLSQLNRESEQRGSARHRLSDLRDSGDIEQDADKVFFISRPGVFEGDLEDRKIHIQKEKDRNGKAPIIYQLVRDYSFTNFYDEADPRDIGNRGGQAF